MIILCKRHESPVFFSLFESFLRPLCKRYEEKSVHWAKKYIKDNSTIVIITGKHRDTLDEPDDGLEFKSFTKIINHYSLKSKTGDILSLLL